ncbi:MAG: hypothetical protein CMJ46_10330 [Planctomyces sp.]|nr:hypothetical protein [Planctomyces sp.]
MAYDFPPPDHQFRMWLALGLNSILMLPFLIWGVGLLRRKGEQYETEPTRRSRWITAILLSFSGLSFLPFILMIPVALLGRLLERYYRNPLPMIALVVLPMLLFCISNWPMFAGANEVAGRSNCRDHLKSLATAFDDYHQSEGHFPPAVFQKDDGTLVSWRVEFADRLNVLPPEYDRGLPWNDAVNRPLLDKKPSVFTCPTDLRIGPSESKQHSSYAMVTGLGTIHQAEPLPGEEFTDGTSTTILLGEAAGLQIPWTEPRDINVDMQPVGINLPGSEPHHSPGWFSSYHEGGAFFTMADGSVQWFGEKIDPKILKALVTPQGGETVELGKIMD